MCCLLFPKSRTPAQTWAPLTSQHAASATRPSATPPRVIAPPSAWTPLLTAPNDPSATAPRPPLPPPGTVTAPWAAVRPLSRPLSVTPWPLTGTPGRFDWNWSLPGSLDAKWKMRETMETEADRLLQNIYSLSWVQKYKRRWARCRDPGRMWTGWCRRFWTQKEPTFRICAAS